MATAVSGNLTLTANIGGFGESEILRRKIKGELAEIKSQIDASGLNDDMTKSIELWRSHFSKAFELNVDGRKILEAYIPLLQDLLIDAFAQPMDENALLGSDGKTYGHMSLSLYINSTPDIYKNRSPCDPENPKPFTVVNHPVVGHMIAWLKKHHAQIRSRDLESQYNLLVASHCAPALPFAAPLTSDPRDKIRQIFARQAQRERQRKLEMEQFVKKLEQDKQTKIASLQQNHEQIRLKTIEYERLASQKLNDVANQDTNTFAELERNKKKLKDEIDGFVRQNQELETQIKETGDTLERYKPVISDLSSLKTQAQMQKILARQAIRDKNKKAEMQNFVQEIDQIKHTNKAEIDKSFGAIIKKKDDHTQKTIVKIQEIGKLDQKLLDNLTKAKDKLLKEIDDLKNKNIDLEKEISKVNKGVDSIKADDLKLNKLINETRQAIKEREAAGMMGLVATVAIIGVCAFATWGLATIVPANMSVTATPLSRGLQLGISLI